MNHLVPLCQDILIHECGPQFPVSVFSKWLGEHYTIHHMTMQDCVVICVCVQRHTCSCELCQVPESMIGSIMISVGWVVCKKHFAQISAHHTTPRQRPARVQ